MIIVKNYNKNTGWAEGIIEGYDSFAALVTDRYIDFDDKAAEDFEKEYFDITEDEIVRNDKPLTEEEAAFWWKQINGRESELVEVVGGVQQFQIYFKKSGKTEWEKIGSVRSLNDFNRDFADWINKYGIEEAKTWEEALEVLNSVGASAWAGIFCLGAE